MDQVDSETTILCSDEEVTEERNSNFFANRYTMDEKMISDNIDENQQHMNEEHEQLTAIMDAIVEERQILANRPRSERREKCERKIREANATRQEVLNDHRESFLQREVWKGMTHKFLKARERQAEYNASIAAQEASSHTQSSSSGQNNASFGSTSRRLTQNPHERQ
jgi:hypothetical protein